MLIRKVYVAILLLVTVNLAAQKNFTYSPEKPKPGDVITFTYEPAGDLAKTDKAIEAAVYQSGPRGRKADDLLLEKKDGKYVGNFSTDTAMSFVYLAFSADKKFDNNSNEGYTILLYDGDQPRSSAYFNLGSFYQYLGRSIGLDADNEKALAAMEKEIELYPDNKKTYLFTYVRLQTLVKKDEAQKIIQKEIESLLKAGLNDETDYNILGNLYSLAKLPEQYKFVVSVKKEKFPAGKWIVAETIGKFNLEKDVEKKKAMLPGIVSKIETDEIWENYKPNLDYIKSSVARLYIEKKDWLNFKKTMEESNIGDKTELASLYNSAAWEMQKTGDNLKLAEEFSRYAINNSKEQWKNPTGKKPDYMTQKQWADNNKSTYAQFADTYGMVLYRMSEYKKGLRYAKDAAIVISKGVDPDQNNTYALLAEKVLLRKQYVKELEQFVANAKSTKEIKDILQRAYVKNKKSEAGFDAYIANLQKTAMEKMVAELRKTMLNEKAPAFALVDLNGKKVDLGDLQGKVVVVDFWATWCGPCKASFPGMQKMVNKYKDDPNVKFVFVDTWERGDGKEKNAAEFIDKNKYTFHVLMDNDDKVVAEFKVDGIPTKFVLDKRGMIRFKSVGFDGSEDKLMNELSAMIEIAAKESETKAF